MRLAAFALCIAISLATLAAPARAESPFTNLYDLDRLPILRPAERVYQVSSRDPSGGNADYGHVVRRTGDERVLADLKGPGVVRRIWSANPTGLLRIFIDGAERPVLEAPFADLFEDRVPGFRSPIAGKSSGGWYSYVPIPFLEACRITVTGGEPFYYQVTWQEAAPGADISPFSGAFGGYDAAEYEAARRMWSDLGRNTPDDDALTLPERSFSLPPAGRWVQPVQGPGTITALGFRFGEDTTFEDLRRSILRISFDDGPPAVEAPLGDFFGIGFNGVTWRSLALGAHADGAYCYFRMPFAKTARIEIENQGKRSLFATFSGAARAGTPDGPWGYFHASYRTAVTEAGRHYPVARLRGAGHVVGVTHAMRGTVGLGFLEGDEIISVDGEAIPGIRGTGTEDYYNCGWYYATGPVDVATHGCSHKTDNEIGTWRLHIPDPIPFTRSLDFRLEHGATNDAPGSEYSSVVYWYGAAGARDLSDPLPTGSELMPKPFIAPVEGAIEAEATRWTVSRGASYRQQAWHRISPFRGGGRVRFQGEPGDTLTTTLEFPFEDIYDVQVFLSGANTSSTARIVMDGQAVGDLVQDGTGPLPVRKIAVGSVRLAAGKHTFGLRIGRGSAIGLDAFRIVPRSGLVRNFAVLGPFSTDPDTGIHTPLPPDGLPPDLKRTYRTANGEAGWRILQTPQGILDLGAVLSPNRDAVAYVAFAVHSPAPRSLPLMLGSDDGVAAWVNGERVFAVRKDRGLKVDEDRVPIRLREGWNTVLLKVDQRGGPWSVAARLPDPDQTLQFAAVAPD